MSGYNKGDSSEESVLFDRSVIISYGRQFLFLQEWWNMMKALSEETPTEIRQGGNRYLRQPVLRAFGSEELGVLNEPICTLAFSKRG